MKVLRLGVKSIAIAAAVLSMSAAHAQFAGVTAGVAANQLISQLDGVINGARDAGDYLVARAGMEAKGAIEAWKDANKALLDQGFDKLDQSQQKIFSNARQLADQANAHVEDRLKHTEAITNQFNQVLVSVPGNSDTYVTQFYPRVIPSQAASDIILTVKGVNLDKGEPVMTIADMTAQRMVIGPMEVHYTVPLNQVKREPGKLAIVPLTLTYSRPMDGLWNRMMGKRESVERQIPVVALPVNIGSYRYTAVAEVWTKEVEQFSSQSQKFEGKNTDKKQVAMPKPGWQWDWSQGLSAFSQHGDGGHAGSCNGIMANESSNDGITHRAHLDKQQKMDGLKIVYGPGKQNCYISGPVFRMVKTQTTVPATTGALLWTEDLRLPIPQGFKSLSLEVTTFDGRKLVITGAESDKFFNVIQDASELVIKPKQPADI